MLEKIYSWFHNSLGKTPVFVSIVSTLLFSFGIILLFLMIGELMWTGDTALWHVFLVSTLIILSIGIRNMQRWALYIFTMLVIAFNIERYINYKITLFLALITCFMLIFLWTHYKKFT